MKTVRVSGEPSLVKDLVSGAVLADDRSGLELRRLLREGKRDRISLLERTVKELSERISALERGR